MKKKLILILSILTFISCDVASVDLDDQNYVFDGGGGVKCEVNGMEFIPRGVTSPGANSMELNFAQHNGEEYLYLNFNNRGENNELLVVSLLMNNINPYENDLTGMIIELNDDSMGMYRIVLLDEYSTNTEYIGELEIVYHDQDERILAGRFWYDSVNSNNEIVEISNGEFDMIYY